MIGVAALIYIIAGVWLLTKARVILAGLTTLLIAVSPILWLLTLPPNEVRAPGTGIFLMVWAIPICLSIVMITVGLGIAVIRYFGRARSGAEV